MYTRISRSGGRSYLQLVEAYRDDAGRACQRTVANLGRIDQLQNGALDPIIRGLQRVASQSPTVPARIPKSGPECTPEFTTARAFGDLYALHQLWHELGLGVALRRCFRSPRRQFDAEALVRAMVFNRLCAPCSKLGLLDWLDSVAMPDCPHPTHQQLLRAMDVLVDHMDAVESVVCQQVRPLIDQSMSIMFYDMTTIRISSETDDSSNDEIPLRAFGLSKDGGIRRQFVVGVVQSADGIPLLHTTAPGNVSEVSTLRPMLEHALKRFDVRQIVIVADRGLLSLDNLKALEDLARVHQRQLDFILAVPARRYAELPEIIRNLTFIDGLAEGQFAGYRMVVTHDPERALAQQTKREQKLVGIEALGQRLAEKLDQQDDTERTAKGRKASDRGAYARFAKALKEQQLTRFFKIDWNAELFSFERNTQAINDAKALDGSLVILTSLAATTMDAAQVIARYKALADIERGFRTLKSDIDIAPVHHRLESRIRAHALICFLALLLHRVLRMKLKASGSTLSPKKALVNLQKIQRHNVKLGERVYEGMSKIDPDQRTLLTQLKLALPD